MSKFKVGDEVEAVSESFTWGYVKVGDLGVVMDKYEEQLIVDFPNQSLWYCHEKDLKLVKDKWSIYNNTLPWSQLSDKQKGKLLLASHSKIKFTCNKVYVSWDVAFNNKGGIYIALEPVKPEPTMAELLTKDILGCSGFLRPHDVDDLIAKGWTKPCK
jgi:hypothetical protein